MASACMTVSLQDMVHTNNSCKEWVLRTYSEAVQVSWNHSMKKSFVHVQKHQS